MSTKIEWCDETWNPVTGCTKISPACDYCYAERMSKRLAGRCGYPSSPDNFRVTLHPDKLAQPLSWKKPKRIFVVSMGDLFHPSVPNEYIAAVFGVMAACPQHTFLILTKRPTRALEWFDWANSSGSYRRSEKWALAQWGWSRFSTPPPVSPATLCEEQASIFGLVEYPSNKFMQWPLPNVWIGVTAEDQPRWNERVGILRQIPAVVRFVSVEPSLGHIIADLDEISWLIVGGETGPKARPMHLDWARSLRDQCVEANVPFFFKQMSGRGMMPEDLNIREWPNQQSTAKKRTRRPNMGSVSERIKKWRK